MSRPARTSIDGWMVSGPPPGGVARPWPLSCLPFGLYAGLAAVMVSACGSVPPARPVAHTQTSAEVASRAADHAAQMMGRPYRFGGASPSTGFDCSGLVQFGYRKAGVALPRTTDDLLRASRPVRASDLRRGDLIFFDEEGKKNSHVGIYLGRGAFVHAPSSGKRVRSDRLDSPYWRRHLADTRRV